MMNQEEQQALALVATVQALSIVNDVATQGKFDGEYARPLLQSLVTYNPAETLDAYGGNTTALRFGITQVKKLLSDDLSRDIAQYLLAVIAIELKLVRNNHMRQLLQSEMQRIAYQHSNQTVAFDNDNDDDWDSDDEPAVVHTLTDADTIGEFAELYKQTASQIEPRIMIKGNHQYLQQESSANQIRALLLAALRGAAFFRHNGGKRLDLMVKRGRYVEIIDKL